MKPISFLIGNLFPTKLPIQKLLDKMIIARSPKAITFLHTAGSPPIQGVALRQKESFLPPSPPHLLLMFRSLA